MNLKYVCMLPVLGANGLFVLLIVIISFSLLLCCFVHLAIFLSIIHRMLSLMLRP